MQNQKNWTDERFRRFMQGRHLIANYSIFVDMKNMFGHLNIFAAMGAEAVLHVDDFGTHVPDNRKGERNYWNF